MGDISIQRISRCWTTVIDVCSTKQIIAHPGGISPLHVPTRILVAGDIKINFSCLSYLLKICYNAKHEAFNLVLVIIYCRHNFGNIFYITHNNGGHGHWPHGTIAQNIHNRRCWQQRHDGIICSGGITKKPV